MEPKNITLSLPKKIFEIINKDYDYIGNTESERIQNIIISSIFLQKQNINSDKHEIRQIKDNINVIENVVSSIIDLHVIDEYTECNKKSK